MLRRGLLAGAITVLFLASASAESPDVGSTAPAPGPVDMTEVAAGDHWTYEVTDEISGKLDNVRTFLVTEVTKNDVTVRFDVTGTGRSGLIVYDRSWNTLSNSTNRFTPSEGNGVRLPLTLNAQWKFTSNSVNINNGATFKLTGSTRVTGKETVTTKAGTFEAFVLETTNTARNVQNPSHAFETTMKTWFSPTVNHWIKRTITVRNDGHLTRNESTELTEFGRKK
jgi:hypothetical protein